MASLEEVSEGMRVRLEEADQGTALMRARMQATHRDELRQARLGHAWEMQAAMARKDQEGKVAVEEMQVRMQGEIDAVSAELEKLLREVKRLNSMIHDLDAAHATELAGLEDDIRNQAMSELDRYLVSLILCLP